MPPLPGMVLNWHSLIARHARELRLAWSKVARAIDTQVAGRSQAQLETVLARNIVRQPVHPIARIRQGQNRWYSTARNALRHFATDATSAPTRQETAAFLKTRVGTAIRQSNGRAPFASTLRPNLTGGTIGRTAGGYTLGSGRIGGARYFSHGPASQAQVVQNVSQAMRAFCLNGHKAQFDGYSHSGEKRFKSVSTLQEETSRTVRSVSRTTPGSWIDFGINPTITALTPLNGFELDDSFTTANTHLNADGLIDILSVDFSRALKDLAVVLNDIKRLSSLGDLPISLKGSNIRVFFPGCDADIVERMCAELNIQRGIVTQDPAFDAFVGADMALLFPFAPSEHDAEIESLFTPSSPIKNAPLITLDELLASEESDTRSIVSEYSDLDEEWIVDEWTSKKSSYQSVHTASISGSDRYSPLEYQGIEGIYRFLEQCDSARR